MMMLDLMIVLLVAATAADGILAGASLDQSIKQLPARHRMGVVAFSVYSQASDLGPGIIWYAILGIGAAALTVATAAVAFLQGIALQHAMPVYGAAVLAVLHSLATTQAAPTNFRQRKVANDEAALKAIFNRFERWQTVRVVLQGLTFGAMLWALTTYMH
jgi:hypothetical protein